jgi:myosin tail region-interacting protein MTI1
MATVPFRVKALFDYSSPHEDDLTFAIGQIITVTEEEDADWYCGEYIDDSGAKQEGLFPRNFVEKYEPTAPPRPTRTRTKKESETAAAAPESASQSRSLPEEPAPPPPAEEDAPAANPIPPAAPVIAAAKPAEPVSAPQPVSVLPKLSEPPAAAPSQVARAPPAATKPSGAPSASDKPSSSSFKDRIAAFNKSVAPPPAPFKPSGLAAGGGAGFIKKPFVAPPPSRNAYVPPPREAPTAKVYRRDEDPEIREREAENLENAERAGLVPAGPNEGDDEDQPKPTSLKERIALLQKQQMEQAQRHAEAAAKKDKPKRPPPKKRSESHEQSEPAEAEAAPAPPALERRDTEDTGGKRFMDSTRAPPPPRRKSSSRGPAASETFNDGNEADMSGAGDTEDQEDLTERDDSDERPRLPSRAPTKDATREQDAEEEGQDAEEEGEDEDEDDIDPEVRRKEELRARMAKMSGGMGMHGIFGSPGMMPMGGLPPPKKKKTAQTESHSAEQEPEEASPSSRAAPPIPMMIALPGMTNTKRNEEATPTEKERDRMSRAPPPPPRPVAEEEEEDEEEEEEPQPRGGKFHRRHLLWTHQANQQKAPSRETAGPPPIPGGRPAPHPVPGESSYTYVGVVCIVIDSLHSEIATSAPASCWDQFSQPRL